MKHYKITVEIMRVENTLSSDVSLVDQQIHLPIPTTSVDISKGLSAKISSKLKNGEENESENMGADTSSFSFFFCT